MIINKDLAPGESVVRLRLSGIGEVTVHDGKVSTPELITEARQILEHYSDPSDGYPSMYIALELVSRYGGRILSAEVGDSEYVSF